MAKDTLAAKGIPLEAKGMNDNTPLDASSDFYQTRGVHSLHEQCLQRCNGKSLFRKYDSPILAIHGDLRGRIWIETATQLLMLDGLTDENLMFQNFEPIKGDDGVTQLLHS
jgi:hypothetical protein